jgi:hypothetical protein
MKAFPFGASILTAANTCCRANRFQASLYPAMCALWICVCAPCATVNPAPDNPRLSIVAAGTAARGNMAMAENISILIFQTGQTLS